MAKNSPVAIPVSPLFDYESVPGYQQVLQCAQMQLLTDLSTQSDVNLDTICDTRPTHYFMFKDLTPKNQPDFAGHYRGSSAYYLKNYKVKFGQNEGALPVDVESSMEALAYSLRRLYKRFLSNSQITGMARTTILYNFARLAAITIIDFIKIHPYADGNGHISRFIACAYLMPHKLIPTKWQIDPRPNDQDYSQGMIGGVRDANLDILTNYLIDSFM